MIFMAIDQSSHVDSSLIHTNKRAKTINHQTLTNVATMSAHIPQRWRAPVDVPNCECEPQDHHRVAWKRKSEDNRSNCRNSRALNHVQSREGSRRCHQSRPITAELQPRVQVCASSIVCEWCQSLEEPSVQHQT
ncbi:hypothetical protein KC19_11G131600 [Ceratodon purpureus]|uniref:Uncharacterized protein n=1 Tax=Ceratodon purpureus TaxID=3225 RepID=A0A8T0GGL1_CERPU|nr:hypothetical protein KC19_11G131600 [Ceratodon purpureus]